MLHISMYNAVFATPDFGNNKEPSSTSHNSNFLYIFVLDDYSK